MAEKDKVEFISRHRLSEDNSYTHVAHVREILTPVAQLAADLIQKWGMVAAAPDGEDHVGRQKMRLLAPAEVVERACSTAEAAYATFRARGWVVELGSWAELKDEADDRLEADEERSDARRNRRQQRVLSKPRVED